MRAVELLHGPRWRGADAAGLWLVRAGAPLPAGLLEGITRGFLFDLAREAGVDAREQTLRPDDLESADEAFITGTTRELSPVVRIDERVIGNGKPGPVTLDLLARYRRYAWESTKAAVPSASAAK